MSTMVARAVPEVPWSVLWEPDAWQALSCAIHRVPTPPAEPPTRAASHPQMWYTGVSLFIQDNVKWGRIIKAVGIKGD